MNFCLSQTQIAELKTEMKKVGGNKLAAMSFSELETFFTGVMGNEQTAVAMAKGFKLAVISTRKNALGNWLKNTLTEKEVETYKKSQASDERAKVLAEYNARIKEIRAEYKAKKITNSERLTKEKLAKNVKDRAPITVEQKATRNIARLTQRLEDIKAGKLQTRASRELTKEEIALHEQIDAEVAKLAKDVKDVYENMDQDVIERALGYSISPDEVEHINRLTEKMNEAEQKTPDNPFNGLHSDYFKAKKELNDYLDTVNQMSKMDVLNKIIFRGTLLSAPKSIVTNVVGNTTMGAASTIVSSIQHRTVFADNTDLILPFAKNAVHIYNTTNIDTVRVLDGGGSDQVVLGEHFQGVGEGGGVIRKYGRFMEQYVFRYGQGTPDVFASALHFGRMASILSTKFAAKKGLKGEARKAESKRLMLLAMSLKLDEKTDADAYEIKKASVNYALEATYQNNSATAKVLLDARNALDEYTGIFRIGTAVSPFVKTIVNIAVVSARISGVALPFEVPKLVHAIKTGDTETMNRATQGIILAGLGLVLVQLLASAIDDDDYMPDYLLATGYQKDLAKLNNAPYNSVRIGDKWISLGYTPFGWALAATLSAKRKQGVVEKTATYVGTIFTQTRQVPVIQQILGVYDYLDEVKLYAKTADEQMNDAIAWTADFFSARTVPAFVSDLAKAFDDKERVTQFGYEGIADRFKAKIPFVRESLPEKHDGLGEIVYTENAFWVMMAGSRVKTAPKDTEVMKELTRLSASGEDVKIKYNTNKDIKMAKKLLPFKEYNAFEKELQKSLMNAFANKMSEDDYKEETDIEEQKAMLMKLRDGVLLRTLDETGYLDMIRDAEYEEKVNSQ